MKKTAFALALVILALMWAHPLLASDPAPLDPLQKNSPNIPATRQGTINRGNACPVEEGALLRLQGDFGWRQSSLAHASVLIDKSPFDPTADQPAPLTVGAWFMGLGLVVFIITRKRYRS